MTPEMLCPGCGKKLEFIGCADLVVKANSVEIHGEFVICECMKRTPTRKIEEALNIINNYAGQDGGSHKQWCIDQVVRILAKDYKKWVAEYENGGEYKWDVGVPWKQFIMPE